MKRLRVGLIGALVLSALFAGSGWPAQESSGELAALEKALLDQGVHFKAQAGVCAISARVLVREDALEYLLVNRAGNAHESLFVTDVQASQLNVGLLALGVQPGRNAVWTAKDPPPTREEMLAGAQPYDVKPPEGEGFLLYVAWKEGEELYFYRVDDLIKNLSTARSMQRHAWVYLGSRTRKTRDEPPREVFAADVEGNLINVCYFEAGTTLITGSLPDCLLQNIWAPNAPLLPPQGAEVLVLFSRKRLETCPQELRAVLPQFRSEPEADPDSRPGDSGQDGSVPDKEK